MKILAVANVLYDNHEVLVFADNMVLHQWRYEYDGASVVVRCDAPGDACTVDDWHHQRFVSLPTMAQAHTQALRWVIEA